MQILIMVGQQFVSIDFLFTFLINTSAPHKNESKSQFIGGEKENFHFYISDFGDEPKLSDSEHQVRLVLISYIRQIISLINEDCITCHDCLVTRRGYLHDFSPSVFISCTSVNSHLL